MANSTHRVEVVPISLEPHPDADTLSIVRVFDGYTCVVQTAAWTGVDRAAYIPPDSIVPDLPEYAFLGGNLRIKARKLRGIMSEGLLVPAPEGSQIGDDVAAALGVTHYVPRAVSAPGVPKPRSVQVPPPAGCEHVPVYDLEAYKKYGRTAFEPGEFVHVTEKLHGENMRAMFKGGEFFVGSRKRWVAREDANGRPNRFWTALDKYEGLRIFLQEHEGCVVFGEVYGWVQDLRYGHGPGEVSFAAFDVMQSDGRWMSWVEAMDSLLRWAVPVVPYVDSGPFDFDAVLALASGPSLVRGANHIREGVVVRPSHERRDPRFGRCVLKIVSAAYLARSK